MNYKRNTYKEVFFLVVFFLIIISILFHVQIQSNFGILTGDRFDGLIENNLLHHWFNTFTGKSNWKTVGYFYPYLDTLGYNDGYFIYGVIYSFYKMLGFDIFVSAELVNITLKAIGYFSFYLLCYRSLKLKFWYSFIGAAIFTLANSLVVQSGHAQLLSLAFAPLLTYFIFNYILNLFFVDDKKKAVIYGSLSGLLLSGWLITTFYMAWFYIFFFITTFVVFLFFFAFNKKQLPKIEINKKISVVAVIFPMVVFLISIIPFLIVYLPKMGETGGHAMASILAYAPSLGNILNPGNDNLLFGVVAKYIYSTYFPEVNRVGEFNIGFPPIILLLTLYSLYFFAKAKLSSLRNIFTVSISVSIIISLLFILKVNGHSLWEVIWHVVPGAKGMRVTARYALFIIFPLSLFAALFLAQLESKLPKFLLIILSLVLIIEQINFATNQGLERSVQMAFINSVPQPPSSCASFFVTGQRPGEYPIDPSHNTLNLYPHNVDAMFISEYFGLRTINGFSSFNPKDWDFKLGPQSTYVARVFNYAKKHNIEQGLCEYDLYSSKWQENVVSNPLKMIKISSSDLTLNLLGKPTFSTSKDAWEIDVLLTNHGNIPIGEKSFVPLNLGIRKLNDDSSVLTREFIRVNIPHISPLGGEAIIKIIIPRKDLKTNKIDVLPVQEGIAWLDRIGIKPLVIDL